MEKYFIYALLAATCWGIAPIFEKIGLRVVSIPVAIFIRSGLTLLVLMIVIYIGRKKYLMEALDIKGVIFVVLGGIFSVLLAQFLYFAALRKGDASKVIPVIGVYPAFTLIFSFLLLGEKITFVKIIGLLLITIGLMVISSN